MNKLDKTDILSHLDSAFWSDVIILDSVDSTNRYAKNLARDGRCGCYAVTAEQQTAGRGRMQRSFSSPAGSGIYLSLVYDLPLAASDAGLITVYTAAVVAEAIAGVTGVQCDIKWVNDLYLDGKKICGILTEGAIDPASGNFSYFIVGIGINVATPSGGFTGAAKGIAGSICDGMNGDIPQNLRNLLIAAIMNRMQHIEAELQGRAYLKIYRERSMLTGKEVTVYRTMIGSDEHYKAIVTGMDDDGHLMVQDESGQDRILYSGEVSVKLT